MKGCFGKILTVLLCLILGGVLTIGGIAGAGYWFVTKKGSMGNVAEWTSGLGKDNGDGTKTPYLNISEENQKLSILEFGKGFVEKVTSLDTSTIGSLEDYLGLTTVSDLLNQYLGVEKEDVRASTFSGLGETITSKLTIGTVLDKFGGSLPDEMPIFSNETFLNAPITEAFSDLGSYTLGDFLKIEDDASGVLLQLRDTPIDGISDKISTLTIGEIIPQDENTSPIISALSDLTIDELGGSKFQEKINGIKLSDVMTGLNEDTSNGVLYSLKDCTIGELQGAEADAKIKSMFLSDFMEIDASSTAILRALQYACIESQYVAASEILSAAGKYALGTEKAYTYLDDTVVRDGETYYQVYYYPEGAAYEMEEAESGGFYKVNVAGESLYVYASDVDKTEGDTLYTNNLYCFFYNETGEPVRMSNTVQADKTAYLWIPVSFITDIDSATKTITASTYYLYTDDSHSKAYDGKIVKTGETEDADKTAIYEYKPLIGINDKIETLELADAVEIDDDSPVLLRSLRDKGTTIVGIADEIDTLLLSEVVEIDSSSPKILQTLSEKNTTVTGIGDAMDTLKVSEIIEIDDSSAKILQTFKTKGTTVNGLGDAMNDLTIGDAVAVEPTSPQILISLQDKKITEMGDAMGDLKISEVFAAEDREQGILSLIDAETKLDDISDEVAHAVQQSTVAVLIQTGVIDSDSFTSMSSIPDDGVRAFIYNSSMTTMMGGLIDFVANPVVGMMPNYAAISPNTVNIAAGSYSSLTDFVAAYQQYDVINFTGSVTVSIDATADEQWAVRDGTGTLLYYAIPFYCVGSEDYTVTYSGGSVHIAVYEIEGGVYTYSSLQAGFHFDKYAAKHSTPFVGLETGIVTSFS